MECNKEEAIRAKGIAEQKMLNKDFVGARKIALKAQQLYPDLDNISQIISVCDVHCSSEHKIFGNEMDWYGILQIEQTSDDATIKKQYRKFALLLHPDKNKFFGAEAAFKLIGEAQRVLLDPIKRSLHNMKRRASLRTSAPSQPPHQANRNPNLVQKNYVTNTGSRFSGSNPLQQGPQQQNQPGLSNIRQTFWTVCPHCLVRYQYYREIVNRSLRCQSCRQSFLAIDMNAQGPTPVNQSTFSPGVPYMATKNTFQNYPSNAGSQRTTMFNDGKTTEKGGNSDVKKSEKERGCAENKPTKKVNGKRERKLAEDSSESGYGEDVNSRRSARKKGNVSYNENLSDDGLVSSPKRARGTGVEDVSVRDNEKQAKRKENGSFKESVPNGYKETEKEKDEETAPEANASDPEVYVYPDPDFSDFDKQRTDSSFAVGQLWAIYDTIDAMPRFYAFIKKVFSPGFRLKITWLEPDPYDPDEINWANEDLPVSCGKFRIGHSENTEDQLMFSHLATWEKGSGRCIVKIYPRMGETWALFKNWNMNWKSDPENHRKYEFEFVEILSEYEQDNGITVAYLGKVKGFASIFCRTMKEGKLLFNVIPPNEIFRFSHRVPSFKMTGEEREDVPIGSFELDPGALPTTNVEEISVSEDLKMSCGSNGATRPSPSKNSPKAKKDTHPDPDENCLENDEAYEIPEPEFYNFDAEKSEVKFKIGQTWALYCDEDGLPKYYAQIKKIDTDPDFKVHVNWLVSCSLPSGVVRWLNKDMPICCGFFKLKSGKPSEYSTTTTFSHQLKVTSTEKRNLFSIFPRKGDVWAMYRSWKVEMTCSDLENCEYDIVEILEVNELRIEVLVLDRVDGFNSVFKGQVEGVSPVKKDISKIELLRFSHQIPAFRLTEERGGSLRGCWELDPAALPVLMFCSD